MLLTATDISKSFLDQKVLQNVSIEIKEGDRVGLLGINGAGKTTLLNILAGDLEPDSGILARATGVEVGYLRQNDALHTGFTIEQEIRDAFAGAYKIEADMQRCYAALEKDPQNQTELAQLDRLTARFEALDGYHLEDRAARVLNGLGFADFDRATPVATLSGGEKMRFGIAKMLLRQPDVLILDEPTNHLDFSMLQWLEDYLGSYKGAVLVVSHDRYFLDSIAQDICELQRTHLVRYKGGYSQFVVQKAERYKVALRAWEKQQEEIAKLEEFVAKNLAKSSSINSVGSRVKQLEKMERLEKPAGDEAGIHLKFDYDVEPFSLVLQCEQLGVRVGDEDSGRELYTGVDLAVRRGEKVALVGLNGVGKSTFLRAVQGLMEHTGRVQWGGNVRLGYFDQELADLDLDATVLEAVHSCYPVKTEFEIRSALGRLLINGDDVYKKIRQISGAMRAKVAFVILEMRRANVLILDEPTNHLDYKAKEELERALRAFTGTLVVVSHDRYFLRQVPGRILELRPDGFTSYEGNYDYYLERVRAAEAVDAARRAEEKQRQLAQKQKENPGGYRSREQRAQDAQRRTRIAALEKDIARLEEESAGLQQVLADPDVAADYEKLTEATTRFDEVSAALDGALEEWAVLSEEA